MTSGEDPAVAAPRHAGGPTDDAVGPAPALAPEVTEAARAVASAYADNPAVDVVARLRLELAERDSELDAAALRDVARIIRAGRTDELTAASGSGA